MYRFWTEQIAEEVLAPYRKARVLVLGATGFIGRHVTGVLAQCGAEVHVGVRDSGRAAELLRCDQPIARIHSADLRRERILDPILESVQPAITFNLAGYGIDRSERDQEVAFRINDAMVGELAESLLRHRDPSWTGQVLVHVGSALEYGRAKGDLVETTVCKPTTLYGRSKAFGTERLAEVCRNRSLRALTARLFTVFGPGEHEGRILPSLLNAAATGEVLPLTEGLQRRDFTFVGDVVEGLLRLGIAEAESGEIVNLATGKLATIRQFVETAVAVLDLRPEQLQFGSLPTRAEEMEHGPINTVRLRSLLAWEPRTRIADGIAQTRDWYDTE